jgi:hypothetical protein
VCAASLLQAIREEQRALQTPRREKRESSKGEEEGEEEEVRLEIGSCPQG